MPRAASAEVDRSGAAGDDRDAERLGERARPHLVAEQTQRRGRRADEGEARGRAQLGELGVLGEEAVAGVDAVAAVERRGPHECLGVEVGGDRSACRPSSTATRGEPGVERRASRPARTRRPTPCRARWRPWRCGWRSRRGWRSERVAAAALRFGLASLPRPTQGRAPQSTGSAQPPSAIAPVLSSAAGRPTLYDPTPTTKEPSIEIRGAEIRRRGRLGARVDARKRASSRVRPTSSHNCEPAGASPARSSISSASAA